MCAFHHWSAWDTPVTVCVCVCVFISNHILIRNRPGLLPSNLMIMITSHVTWWIRRHRGVSKADICGVRLPKKTEEEETKMWKSLLEALSLLSLWSGPFFPPQGLTWEHSYIFQNFVLILLYLLTVAILTSNPLFMSSRFSFEDCKATADWLLAQTDVRPIVGIVCGSGLGGLADMLKDQVVFNYKDIPNFPQSTGEFNCNKLLSCRPVSIPCWC